MVSFSVQPGSKLKGKGKKERNLEPHFKLRGSEHSDGMIFFSLWLCLFTWKVGLLKINIKLFRIISFILG